MSAIVYLILTRNLDLSEEQRLAAAEESELEAAGEATMHEAEAS